VIILPAVAAQADIVARDVAGQQLCLRLVHLLRRGDQDDAVGLYLAPRPAAGVPAAVQADLLSLLAGDGLLLPGSGGLGLLPLAGVAQPRRPYRMTPYTAATVARSAAILPAADPMLPQCRLDYAR
jgi:hypothetical protein